MLEVMYVYYNTLNNHIIYKRDTFKIAITKLFCNPQKCLHNPKKDEKRKTEEQVQGLDIENK